MRRSEGDVHNFGRSVYCNNINTFYKPRTVYWEQLFFGVDSVLKNIFEQFNIGNNLSFGSRNFQLHISRVDKWEGESKNIKNETVIYDNNEARYWGALVAFCYFFGIYDLHRQNFVKSILGPQIIDCETVFGDPILPAELLLLPFRTLTFDACGTSAFFTTKDFLKPEVQYDGVGGFIEMLLFISSHIEEIQEVLFNLPLQEIPIRIIFRNTKDYHSFLIKDSVSSLDQLEFEEQVQIIRGDIPYFFHYLNSPDVFYFIDSNFNVEKLKQIPSFFYETHKRMCTSIHNQISLERIHERLLPHGGLSLIKYFSKYSDSFFHKGEGWQFFKDQNLLNLQVGSETWSAQT